ncbi:hypothetical protein RFI_31527 [Reticulomyxa filosa]|uniref:Uncharacterized protein n=1 Tax=Reticulomyxa filosa TaxID=46433 RepID=X6LXM3_RETFI|nr:hypothetical protein RFI_31527 [Reticulomyxa filosa]|eukprot:ETO05867.1 hypothetical protein RFI_31527 [Reticulomyxa filosa]
MFVFFFSAILRPGKNCFNKYVYLYIYTYIGWLVFNPSIDEVYIIEGYFFNMFFRKINPGKLSQLTAVLITLRISRTRRTNNNGFSSNLIFEYKCTYTASTSYSYDTTLHFANGATRLVGNNSSQARASDFVVKIKEWLDANRPNHAIRCGSADQFSSNVIIQTVINPNQLAEQELRSLIVQYQTSSDPNAQARGQTLSLAMEYNASSLVGTYAALKQQNPTYTVQSEAILLNNAQTIINAKKGLVQQQQNVVVVQQQPYDYNQQQQYSQQTTTTSGLY